EAMDQQNCRGRLCWNAPYSTSTPELDCVDWSRVKQPIDAGPDEILPLGSIINLEGESTAKRIDWETNGKGHCVCSGAKSTVYYADSLDFPLCSLTFYFRELEQYCELQMDSMRVEWKETGISIKGLNYNTCLMDSVEIILDGNDQMNLTWETNGSGTFY